MTPFEIPPFEIPVIQYFNWWVTPFEIPAIFAHRNANDFERDDKEKAPFDKQASTVLFLDVELKKSSRNSIFQLVGDTI